jgi:hypothetical protein
MSQRSPLSLSNALTAHPTEASALPPFVRDTVQRTVLKFVEPFFDQQTSAAPARSEAVLVAMQRLVAMLNTLRSSPLASLENVSQQDGAKHVLSDRQRLKTLIPYVSEEAYDVLEALRNEETDREQHSEGKSLYDLRSKQEQANCPQPLALSSHLLTASAPHLLIGSTAQTFVTLEALIPSLLWCLARSSYNTLQLIEGARGRYWQPEQGWASGMLRLVVMLEAETPMGHWCFDIATGYPAEKLLEPTAIVQADEPILHIQQSLSAEEGLNGSACQVAHQLTAILQSLLAERLGLQPFLKGVAVELLQPESNWQAGNLRLRLGFEFSAQVSEVTSSHETLRLLPELIEAELMDETIGITQDTAAPCGGKAVTRTIAGLITKTHVSVMHPVGRSLPPSTLVYVTDADSLKRHTLPMTRQQCTQSLSPCQHQQANDESAQLALIVQAAIAHVLQSDTPSIGLLQPMLLMDELVPKLLWSLTSSTYESMQLLGGIAAQVLQPYGNWQQGTLRLIAALHLKAADVDYTLDLSTGRTVLTNAPRLAVDAIVQTKATVCSQPMLVETLTAHLQQQLADAMFEYALLRDGVTIAWLEDVEQDWQPGSMQLSLSLAFIADAL